MTSKINVAVLISGRGSNLQSLIAACEATNFPAVIKLVVSNRPDALGLEIARQAGISSLVIDHKKFSSRSEFDVALNQAIRAADCELTCLAGFMRVLGADFIKSWDSRILNIHPSLLPAFKGADAVGDAIKYGVKISGCTAHLVTEQIDSGPIIKQAAVEVLDSDTKESLAAKILALEHKIYPAALKIICEKLLLLETV